MRTIEIWVAVEVDVADGTATVLCAFEGSLAAREWLQKQLAKDDTVRRNEQIVELDDGTFQFETLDGYTKIEATNLALAPLTAVVRS